MKKPSVNLPCPCGSGLKYKKCCLRYHKGAAAPDALHLMRSRYTAYAVGNSRYIIQTTHPDNPEYSSDIPNWEEEILNFCRHTGFLGLRIESFTENREEAFVTFTAKLSSGEMREKSRFLKQNGRWLYVSGEVH
jgi:SEC-C motif-containing protein